MVNMIEPLGYQPYLLSSHRTTSASKAPSSWDMIDFLLQRLRANEPAGGQQLIDGFVVHNRIGGH